MNSPASRLERKLPKTHSFTRNTLARGIEKLFVARGKKENASKWTEAIPKTVKHIN